MDFKYILILNGGEIAQWLACRPGRLRSQVRIPPSSSARDVKLGVQSVYARISIMHGLKRTWMTMRRCRGPETRRYPACTRELKTEVLGLKGAPRLKLQYYASTHKAWLTRKHINAD